MNASMVLRLEDTLGYNPLRIGNYQRALGSGESAGEWGERKFPGTFRGYRSRLALLLDLEYLVTDRPISAWPGFFPRPIATPIFTSARINVYRLGAGAPRAYLATRVRPVDVASVLDDRALPAFNTSDEVLIDEADLPKLSPQWSAPPSDDVANAYVRVASRHNSRVILKVSTSRSGILVLHDLWYPGWEVSVDGKSKPLLRANVLFRGVEVPAGDHVVRFVFRPFSIANLAAAARGLWRRLDGQARFQPVS
jgi:hypothetical protein